MRKVYKSVKVKKVDIFIYSKESHFFSLNHNLHIHMIISRPPRISTPFSLRKRKKQKNKKHLPPPLDSIPSNPNTDSTLPLLSRFEFSQQQLSNPNPWPRAHSPRLQFLHRILLRARRNRGRDRRRRGGGLGASGLGSGGGCCCRLWCLCCCCLWRRGDLLVMCLSGWRGRM